MEVTLYITAALWVISVVVISPNNWYFVVCFGEYYMIEMIQQNLILTELKNIVFVLCFYLCL